MNEMYFFAKHYRKLGLNVTCSSNKVTEFNFYCRNRLKSPSHQWSHLFTEQQSEEEFEMYLWKNATGVGYASGFKNIRTIDIDGCISYEVLYEVLEVLELPKNYEWVIQSGGKNGFHIIVEMEKYVRVFPGEVVSTYIPLKRYQHLFEKIEILWECNSMLPPSIHPSSNKYSFINTNLPLQAPLSVKLSGLTKLLKLYFNANVTKSSSYGRNIPPYINIPLKTKDDSDYEGYQNPYFYMIVDIETDGLIEEHGGNKKYPNVLQIAWIIMNEYGVIVDSESKIIKSGITSNQAFHINNLDIDVVNQIGVEPQEAYVSFLKSTKNIKYFVAHNIDFDIPVIENQLLKYNLPKLSNGIGKICTMKSSVGLCKLPGGYPYRFPKLPELYNRVVATLIHS